MATADWAAAASTTRLPSRWPEASGVDAPLAAQLQERGDREPREGPSRHRANGEMKHAPRPEQVRIHRESDDGQYDRHRDHDEQREHAFAISHRERSSDALVSRAWLAQTPCPPRQCRQTSDAARDLQPVKQSEANAQDLNARVEDGKAIDHHRSSVRESVPDVVRDGAEYHGQ